MCDKLTWDNSILSDADLAIPSGDPGFFQMLGESGNMFSLTGDFLDGVPPGTPLMHQVRVALCCK